MRNRLKMAHCPMEKIQTARLRRLRQQEQPEQNACSSCLRGAGLFSTSGLKEDSENSQSNVPVSHLPAMTMRRIQRRVTPRALPQSKSPACELWRRQPALQTNLSSCGRLFLYRLGRL